MSKAHRQLPAKRTPAAWAEAIKALECSDNVRAAAACVVWFDNVSLNDGKRSGLFDVWLSQDVDCDPDSLFKALISLGYCYNEAHYRAYEVEANYLMVDANKDHGNGH